VAGTELTDTEAHGSLAGAGADVALDGTRPGPAARAPRLSRARALGRGAALPTAVACTLPLVIAVIALRSQRWYPVLDYAEIEMRVRDVPTRDIPLLGLAGRLQGFGQQGSHPGPLAFWALWPVYRVLGGTAWALQASTAALNMAAIGLACWISHRRAGSWVTIGMGVALALLAHGYGLDRLTIPWNPYVPMLWWVVFLLAVWSVLCDDLRLLPVAVVAGSLCAQTHVPYAGAVAGMLGLAAGSVLWGALRCGASRRRDAVRWGALSFGLLAALWLAPLVEQVQNRPGNLAILRETFAHPREAPLGFGPEALDVWLSHLDVVQLARHTDRWDLATTGSAGVGLAVLAAWGAAAVVAWRRRKEAPHIWRLHVTVGAALMLGLVSVTRIHGDAWSYLVLGAWGTTALAGVATVWTAVARWPAARAQRLRDRARTAGATVLAGAMLAAAVSLTWTATRLDPPDPAETDDLAHLVPDAVKALAAGAGIGGRHYVMWLDEVGDGGIGFGFLLELEREGFDVATLPMHEVALGEHRTGAVSDATTLVQLVRGENAIARVRSTSGVVEVASYDPRTSQEVARFDQLRSLVVAGLRERQLDDLVDLVDVGLLRVAFDDRLPPELRAPIAEMMSVRQPTAVFVSPRTTGGDFRGS
jgi:hypothetical protein